MKAIDKFEKFSKPIYNGQDQLKNHIFKKFPIIRTHDVTDYSQAALYKDTHDYVWLVHKDVIPYKSFPWYFKPKPNEPVQIHAFPYVYKESRRVKSWNKCQLVPTKHISSDVKKHIHIFGEYDVYCGKSQFDIFCIGDNTEQIQKLKQKFKNVRAAKTVQNAMQDSDTDMLWVVYDDTIVRDTFKFTYHPDEWSHEYAHVFGNGDIDQLDGVVLLPKYYNLSKKEIDHRFFANKKEVRIMASNPKPYDQFTINNYNDYLNALQNSRTEMFWGIPSDVNISNDFDFDLYFSHHNRFDRNINHVFLNGEHRDGIVLFSKSCKVTQREIENRFIVNKKEWDTVASTPKPYDQFVINNYDDYEFASRTSKTDLFWGIPSDVNISEDFDFDLYFSHHNRFDRNINHVFLNGEHRDGIVLFSKHNNVSKKEIENRFIVNKKEWDIVASTPKPYSKFNINSYEDYLQAFEQSETEMFWLINPDIKIRNDFNWNFYISHHNRYERQTNHVWLNGKYYDGIFLTTKQTELSKREIDFRFLANKKEHTTVASDPLPYDIVFISYAEPNADKNYELLKQRYPHAKRVHGVKGIHQAHIEAAKLANTDMFWVVDGDAEILDSFNFDYQIAYYDIDGKDTVHVWRSFNPVNNLVYGYGGVKLLPTELTLNMNTQTSDMTTSISDKFKAVPEMSNSTVFNTDAFSSWKSGFRECCKLASRSISRQIDNETEFRLNAWCTRGADKDYGREAILGARQGREYGELNKNNPEALNLINDFEWLYNLFKESCQLNV